jgi:hypothetical protein
MGVSFYSTCLVAFSIVHYRREECLSIAVVSGWIFAISGWVGSALGIGMAKDLNEIPLWFLTVATILFFTVILFQRKFDK